MYIDAVRRITRPQNVGKCYVQSTSDSLAPTLLNAAKIKSIARLAGVSTATVDRVLHNRAHVRETTRQRVLQAKSAIERGDASATQARPSRLSLILPKDAGPSTEFFATCMQAIGEHGDATVEVEFIQKMEPVQLARKLRACLTRRVDAIAFQALDDPRVITAVTELTAANIPCVAVLSGSDNPVLSDFVGMNNRAAGRTAGLMMGRMTRTPGAVLVVTGSDLYRAHEDREIGFRSVLRKDYRHLDIIASLTGYDDRNKTQDVVTQALNTYPDIVGIYNVGAGNQGIAKSLVAAQIADEVTFIGHNLTHTTHAGLLDGTMDAVIHVNLQMAAQQTVGLLLSRLNDQPIESNFLPIEIFTKENTEGAVFG